jgi:chromosomal replication initiator protein DnaA
MAEGKRQKLGEMLVSHGVISKKQLRKALEEWENDTQGKRLGTILVELGYVPEETLIAFLAKQCGIPHLKLSDYEIDSEVIKYLPADLVSDFLAVPIDKLGKILTVAMVDPLDESAIQRIREATGYVVKPIVCTQADMEDAIERYYGKAVLDASRKKREERTGVPAQPEGGEEEVEEGVLGESLQPLKVYTFEDFVVGEASRFTYATAKAVAEAPARDYNPLFIYSGVGLGKTHLLNAIGNYILQTKPDYRVVYLSSERFTSELVDAIQNNRVKEFRKRYRDVDVLLLDDIHFLAGKERAQEEFFHTFNELYNARKQIVVTSDRPPKSMMTLEKRLRSRFEGGIITDMQPPEMETRVAILKKKLGKTGDDVDDDILTQLASKVRTNVRELEGALKAVLARAKEEDIEVTQDLAQTVLRDLLGAEHDEVSDEELTLALQEAETAVELAYTAGADELWPDKAAELKAQLSDAEAAIAAGRGAEALDSIRDLARRAEELADVAEQELIAQEEAKVAAAEAAAEEEALPEEEAPEEPEAEEAAAEEVAEVVVAQEPDKEVKEVAPAEAEVEAKPEPPAEEEGAEELEEAEAEEEEEEPEEAMELEEAEELGEAEEAVVAAAEGAFPGGGTGKEAAEAVAAAQAKVERALAEGAREFALEPLGEAEELLINAEAMLEAEEFEEALAYALRSQERAGETLERTADRKRELHRKEAGENLKRVQAIIEEAQKDEAGTFASELLEKVQGALKAAEETFKADEVTKARRLAHDLVGQAEALLQETRRRRRDAWRRELEKALRDVSLIVDDAKSHGAEKYVPQTLSEVMGELGRHRTMLSEGKYEEALAGSGALLDKAKQLADTAKRELERERALREEASKVLQEAEKLLQQALAAGALRYALELFQRTQVTLAEAQEVLPTEEVRAAQERAKGVLEQARSVLAQIEDRKREEKSAELGERIANLESLLTKAKETGAEKYAKVLLGEASEALDGLRKGLKAGKLDETLAAVAQAQALVQETLKGSEDGLRKEQHKREEIERVLREAERLIAEARSAGAEKYATKHADKTQASLARAREQGDKLEVEEAEKQALEVRRDAEALLDETSRLRKEEKAAELGKLLKRLDEGLVEARGEGSEDYMPDQTAKLDAQLKEVKRRVTAEEYEEGLEIAAPLVGAVQDLTQHTIQRRQEDLELREKATELLALVDERLSSAVELGAENYASEGLKNIQALAARAREVFEDGEVRRAHDLARTVEERATELVEETRLRRMEDYRERISAILDEARLKMKALEKDRADHYAPEALAKARDQLDATEALAKSRHFEEGLAGKDALLGALAAAADEARKHKEEEKKLRAEVEERVAEATSMLEDAVQLGAAQYAADGLEALRETLAVLEDGLSRGSVAETHEASEGLLKEAKALLEETRRSKDKAFRDKVESTVSAAREQIAGAEEIGARRHVPEMLERCMTLVSEVEGLLSGGALEEAVAKSEEMRTTTAKMVEEASRKQREEEEFRRRVQEALRKAEEEVAAALGSDLPPTLHKEAKKADVFLSHARRAHEGGQYDRSLKYSSLATRKAAEVTAMAKAAGTKTVQPPKKKTTKLFSDHPPLREHNFESFLVGEVNRFTYSTVKAVAENPGEVYNPLFIHGAAGLGKTHLMNAAGNYVLDRDPDAVIVYMSSEQFANELVDAIENERVEELRSLFSAVDVLLLDDVQFLAGRQRAQEEFARTFGVLHSAHKQVIITSDKPPSDLVTLQSRLRSKFEEGVITDLQMPEADVRKRILRRLASAAGQEVPEDVIELLAGSIQSSVRELQGALKKLLAYASTNKSAVSVATAEQALKDVLLESGAHAEGELSEEERLLLEEERRLLEEEKLLRMQEEELENG